MSEVHFVMQGKGGVGKSMCSMFLSEYFRDRGRAVTSIDTDPVSATLSAFQGLEARRFSLSEESADDPDILGGGGQAVRVSVRRMEELVTGFLREKDQDGVFVVDIGTSTYMGVLDFLGKQGGLAALRDAEIPLVMNCVIAGGDMTKDCLLSAAQMIDELDGCPMILWSNPHPDMVQVGGKKLADSVFAERHAQRISGIVTLPYLEPLTYGHALNTMLSQRDTFEHAFVSDSYDTFAMSRLGQIRDGYFKAIHSAFAG